MATIEAMRFSVCGFCHTLFLFWKGKNMKKAIRIISVIMVMFVCFSLISCGSNTKEAEKEKETLAEAQTEAQTEAETESQNKVSNNTEKKDDEPEV
ncbi:MAG: hypothetical protein IJS94_08330, partial [Clostridia bacterium]|nr:hypothetical protein [Clostridia bacterium]